MTDAIDSLTMCTVCQAPFVREPSRPSYYEYEYDDGDICPSCTGCTGRAMEDAYAQLQEATKQMIRASAQMRTAHEHECERLRTRLFIATEALRQREIDAQFVELLRQGTVKAPPIDRARRRALLKLVHPDRWQGTDQEANAAEQMQWLLRAAT